MSYLRPPEGGENFYVVILIMTLTGVIGFITVLIILLRMLFKVIL